MVSIHSAGVDRDRYAFLLCPLEIALILPPILYATRATYALKIFIKLEFATGTSDSRLS
jgi:hypothetical protein